MISLRRILLSLLFALAFPGFSIAATDIQLAQSVPVWERGDPVPDAAPDTDLGEMRDMAAPAPLPQKRPLQPGGESATPAQRMASPAPAESEANDPADFLCTRAPEGKTARVPAPFDRWLVRVCSPKGQALVPVKGEAWVAHGSADTVSILAMPPGAVPPPSDATFDARYDIRFETFAGGQTADERFARASALIAAATAGGETVPPHDEVWQLDAGSNVGDAHYNIFFYVTGKSAEGARPHHLIACLDQCRQALYLDVLRGAEAADVLGQ